MSSQLLSITLIQPNIVWEDKSANLRQYEELMLRETPSHIIVLPEMFTTGFSMSPERLAEPMDGPSVKWMLDTAKKRRSIIAGSLIISENGLYHNRLLWVQPDGVIHHYDKRHLFAFAGEDQHYTAGEKRLIVSVNGWKINLMVCYDLRFPVWARNKEEEYDILLYVANWPEKRSHAWKTLLQARAIENQSYVIGVNRVGDDPKGNTYSGDSSIFGPLGETIWQNSGEVITVKKRFDKEELSSVRTQLPFLKDGDKYIIL